MGKVRIECRNVIDAKAILFLAVEQVKGSEFEAPIRNALESLLETDLSAKVTTIVVPRVFGHAMEQRIQREVKKGDTLDATLPSDNQQ